MVKGSPHFFGLWLLEYKCIVDILDLVHFSAAKVCA